MLGKCKNPTCAYNLGFINYRIPEKFMDEHKAAPGDSGQNRNSFLIGCNIEWPIIKMASFHHYFIVYVHQW